MDKTIQNPTDVDTGFQPECEEIWQDSVMHVKKNYSYRFQPEEDGTYQITSMGSTQQMNLQGYLFNEQQELITWNDDAEEGSYDFSLLCSLKKGETYYLVMSVNHKNGAEREDPNSSFQVKISKTMQEAAVIGERETPGEAETEPARATETGKTAETELAGITETGKTAETELARATETDGIVGGEPVEGTEGAVQGMTERITELYTEESMTETEAIETEVQKILNRTTEPESEQGQTEEQKPAGKPLGSEIGLAAGGLAAALAVGYLLGRRRKNKKEAAHQNPSEKVVITVDKKTADVQKLQEESSGIGKVHGIGKRKDQQDSFFVSDLSDVSGSEVGDMLAIVADGIGGLRNGALISNRVVETCAETFYREIETTEPQEVLLKMARCVREQVDQIQQNPGESGSTMVIGLIWRGRLYFLTVGDSRIWLWRKGGLLLLNREHVYREELALKIVNGQDGVASIRTDPQRKLLTSFMGQGMVREIDRNAQGIHLLEGDKILLASDGIFGTIGEQDVEQMLSQTAESAASSVQEAVEQKEKAGQDNYTAVILEYKR